MSAKQTKSESTGGEAARVLRTYVRAKDENRPFLMKEVFCETAVLETVVKTTAISFPAKSKGLATITDVLVRKFAKIYENIYSFYLEQPPQRAPLTSFSCDWIVGMSEKEGGKGRIGCGRYDWQFRRIEPRLADRLLITIEEMQIISAERFDIVLQWLADLPYPWCSAHTILETAPAIPELSRVLKYVDSQRLV